jgi:hypothetical protein
MMQCAIGRRADDRRAPDIRWRETSLRANNDGLGGIKKPKRFNMNGNQSDITMI